MLGTRFARRVRAAQDARRTGRADDGLTLIELLVGMLITVILGIAVVSIYRMATNEGKAMPDRSAQWNAMVDASQQLVRDVGQGSRIEVAEDQRLVVLGQYGQDDVTDAEALECVRREYVVEDAKLLVHTAWLGSAKCRATGAEEQRTDVLIEHYTADKTFTYINESGRTKATPVTDLAGIKVVEWDLSSQIPGLTAPQVLTSAQAFSGRPETAGSGMPSDANDALAPLLTVTTPVVGRDQPVLTWTDASPTLTTGWTIWRAAWPTGTSDAGKLSQVGFVSNPATLTWTDETLKPGESAQYVVTALLRDRHDGPQSNAVITGLHPAAVTGLTATGSGQKVTVTWTAPSGATSFDVYRNGAIVATGVTGTTYTSSNLGYGQNDAWTVGSTNSWGQLWMTGMRGQDVAVGTLATVEFKSRGTRPLPTARPAWTAPPAPTLTASPNANGSNTIAVTFAAWSKPAGTAAATLNRGWEAQGHETGASYANLWTTERAATDRTYTHGGRTAGDTTQYRARVCNSSGCGPWSGADSALQRPPAPLSCVAVLDADTPTRTAVVTINPATMVSTATGYNFAGGTPVDGYSVGWSTASKVGTADRLAHATKHTFTTKVANASGWSDITSCSVTTPAVALSMSARAEWVGSVAQVTRTISAQVKSSNASVVTPTLARNDGSTPATGEDQGAGMKCSASSTTHCTASDSWYWDPLQDDRTYRVRARATDGVNDTTDTLTVSTRELDAPVITVGTVTSRSIAISFTATEGVTSEAAFKRNGILVAAPGHRWYTYDLLADGTEYTLTAVNGDGFNESLTPRSVTTKDLPTPGTATCVATVTDGVAPGAITVSGGDQVKLGSAGTVYDGSRSYGGLTAGTYTGYARNLESDGHNTDVSAWDACPARSITAPFTPSEWDKRAPECPAIGLYIPPTSSHTWQIRRATTSRCDLRWLVTVYGEDGVTTFAGDVAATGSYSIGSGASAYTHTGGAALPMGPLYWD